MQDLTIYNAWNEQKKLLEASQGEAVFCEREIWLASIGQNIGVEINGKRQNFLRPVLIYKKYNINQCFVFPLTTKGNSSLFYFPLKNINFLDHESFLCLAQSRVIDRRRLFRKLGKISVGQFLQIIKSAQALLEPRSPRWQ